jgi:hypothetical protein
VSLLLLFAGAPQGGSGTPPEDPAVSGQPVTTRSQSVPYMAGYRERSGGWNFRLLGDWLDKARRVVTLIWKVTYGPRLAAASRR